jgi:hypothetical protein
MAGAVKAGDMGGDGEAGLAAGISTEWTRSSVLEAGNTSASHKMSAFELTSIRRYSAVSAKAWTCRSNSFTRAATKRDRAGSTVMGTRTASLAPGVFLTLDTN